MTKVISIDLGTTLIKCSLYEKDGKILVTESVPCKTIYLAQDKIEQDAFFWYDAVCEAVKKLVDADGSGEIRGISISSQGISVVPVDKNFYPIYNAISWLDSRAVEECEYLAQEKSCEEWFNITGKFISPLYTLPKILWLRKNEPEIFKSAYKFLLPMDYINARLTGKAVTDHTMASGTMLYNVEKAEWDEELLSIAGITKERLAKVQPSGTFVGCINEETAMRTGLSEGTKVFNGGQDQKVAAYGAEITNQRGSLSLGTAGALEIFVKNAVKQSFLPFFPYTVPGRTMVEGCINTTGAAIGWFKDNLAPDISYDELNALAKKSPVGSNSLRFYPHLSSPGTPHKGLDEFGTIEGVSLGVSRGDLMRSLYEGLAFEIRLNLEYAQKAGSDLKELILFGGASKSDVFCSIIASVTKLKTFASENGEMGGIGAAKLAFSGLGLDGAEFARKGRGSVKEYLPKRDESNKYDILYKEYIKHYESEE